MSVITCSPTKKKNVTIDAQLIGLKIGQSVLLKDPIIVNKHVSGPWCRARLVFRLIPGMWRFGR